MLLIFPLGSFLGTVFMLFLFSYSQDESSSISDLIFGFPSGEKMSFLQRFVNTLNPVLFTVTREWTYLPQLEEITRKGLGLTTAEHEQLPSFREVEKNTSLVLLTTHFSLDFPRSLPPYAIPVGGSVVTKQKKPIPKVCITVKWFASINAILPFHCDIFNFVQEMEDFINSGNQGFIYVSFGTFADFTLFPKQIQLNFINALSNFPETKFIWKSHNDITVTQLPKNVFMTKWAPQQTLLSKVQMLIKRFTCTKIKSCMKSRHERKCFIFFS